MKMDNKKKSHRISHLVPISLFLIAFITLSLNVWGQGVKPRLFVFVNTTAKASTLQKELQSAAPNAEIKVFGRIRDFEKAVADESPEAVIARKNLVQAMKMKPGLQGVRNGSNTEPFALLTVSNSIDIASLNGKNVGVVDEFGRRETSTFVEKALGVKPMVKRTVKVEDLLALLQFAAADAVFLPKRFISVLQKTSQLKLVETALPNAAMALPAAGFSSDEAKSAIAPLIKGFSGSINEKLGVDSWQ